MYGVNNSIQQQLAQNRMNQLETQYNNMFPQQYMQQQFIQCKTNSMKNTKRSMKMNTQTKQFVK